ILVIAACAPNLYLASLPFFEFSTMLIWLSVISFAFCKTVFCICSLDFRNPFLPFLAIDNLYIVSCFVILLYLFLQSIIKHKHCSISALFVGRILPPCVCFKCICLQLRPILSRGYHLMVHPYIHQEVLPYLSIPLYTPCSLQLFS